MFCTQILLLPLTLVYQAMYSIPRGPWLVIWSLYDFLLCLELCCDIFPWVPDLDRTHLRVWLVYNWIEGVTSWYQSRLPVGTPPFQLLGRSWVYSLKKWFTNMDVWLTGPRRHWVVLGSLIPHLYSMTLISLLLGLNEFTNSNIRIS